MPTDPIVVDANPLDPDPLRTEMARLVREAAKPAIPGEKVSHAISRAAKRLGFSRSRTYTLWYATAHKPEPKELEIARHVAVSRTDDIGLLRDEYRRALDIMGRLAVALASTDADFFGADVDAISRMLGQKSGTRGPAGRS